MKKLCDELGRDMFGGAMQREKDTIRLALREVSKNDLISVLEMVNASLSVSTEDQFRLLMKKCNSLIEYQSAICALCETQDKNISSLAAINISYPSEWIEMYVRNEEHHRDPIVLSNFREYRLQYFDDIITRYPPPNDFKSRAYDFGIRSGYVHGVRNNRKSEGSMFCFTSPKVPREERTELIIELIVPHLHQTLTRIIRNDGVSNKNVLSARELEVLKWIKEGKSTWDISKILGISERTVKFHVANIMQKLDVSSRLHAVSFAMQKGLIDIE